jgi:hypothetical protein
MEEIMHDTRTPPQAIIGGGILLDKTLLLVSGKQKSKKTFLVTNLAMAVAAGVSFASFHIPAALKVLILSAEGGYFPSRDRLRIMRRSIPAGREIDLEISFNSRLNLLDERSFGELRDEIARRRPKVLVIDPLVRFHDAEENSATEMSKVLGGMRELIEDFSLSVMLVHHTGKNPEAGARGSSAISGEYDSAIGIKVQDEKHILEFDMRHVETPSAKVLSFNPETLWFEDAERDPIREILVKAGRRLERRELVNLILEAKLVGSPNSAYRRITRSLQGGSIELEDETYFVPVG